VSKAQPDIPIPETARRTRAGKPLPLLCSVILLLGGCSGPKVNPYFAGTIEPSPRPRPREAAPVHGARTNSTSPAVAAPAARWGTGWVPLAQWTAAAQLAPPRHSAYGTGSRYAVVTPRGVCLLTIGSRQAQWAGTSIWLGFAPQLIGGQPYVHAIDIEKTLDPLADARPWRAAGRTIVLDPGHGGPDSGTRGVDGQLEKDFTLDWAQRLEALLVQAGWRVVLTRRTDMEVPLPERVAIADRARADLFISLHFNSVAPQTGPAGIETYCLTPSGSPSTLVRNFPDDPQSTFPNNAFDRANAQMAVRLHRELLDHTRAADGGVRRARFMTVLRGQNRPAVLIEGGYLSNPDEVRQVATPAYRQKLAAAVASALKQI
jgi:N-acetylmuramoyl-L-alanine amidase